MIVIEGSETEPLEIRRGDIITSKYGDNVYLVVQSKGDRTSPYTILKTDQFHLVNLMDCYTLWIPLEDLREQGFKLLHPNHTIVISNRNI